MQTHWNRNKFVNNSGEGDGGIEMGSWNHSEDVDDQHHGQAKAETNRQMGRLEAIAADASHTAEKD